MDIATDKAFKDLSEKLKTPSNISIVTHVNPDGDAIGSALGLSHFLRELDHQVSVITPNEAPEFLQWLPGYQDVFSFDKAKDKSVQAIASSHIIFFLDFNSLSRLEEIDPYIQQSSALRVHIDHHPEDKNWADYNFKTTKVSSTAEIIYEFIRAFPSANDYMNKEIAECLYSGIMTDTVNFRYNVYRRTFHILAEMLDYGINMEGIHSKIYDKFSEKRMQMLGYALYKKMKVLHEYKTAYIALNQDDLEAFNYIPGDTEGFVNLPLSITGITFSALFIEKEDKIKISFRSKGRFAVNEFASQHFEGGGHRNAAGGSSDLSLNDTLEKFNTLVKRYQ